jgi:hypothetical protein
MAQNKLSLLPQTEVTVDDMDYVLNALPTTLAVDIQNVLIENGHVEGWRPDIDLVRKAVVGSQVQYEGKVITKDLFEVHFARKSVHLYKLVDEIIKWNFEDVFTVSDSEE